MIHLPGFSKCPPEIPDPKMLQPKGTLNNLIFCCERSFGRPAAFAQIDVISDYASPPKPCWADQNPRSRDESRLFKAPFEIRVAGASSNKSFHALDCRAVRKTFSSPNRNRNRDPNRFLKRYLSGVYDFDSDSDFDPDDPLAGFFKVPCRNL